MTRQTAKKELFFEMNSMVPNAEVIARLFLNLVFAGASPGEFRGASDAGLSIKELNRVLGLVDTTSGAGTMIMSYLCAE
jgi:hypothetical protein